MGFHAPRTADRASDRFGQHPWIPAPPHSLREGEGRWGFARRHPSGLFYTVKTKSDSHQIERNVGR